MSPAACSTIFPEVIMRFFLLLFPLTLSLVLWVPVSGHAEEILLTKLSPRQESLRKSNGVLVSQPKSLDLEIIQLLQTNQIRSLDDYARWLEENIRYQKDTVKDSWDSPQTTLRRKSGDCEDYTLLNMAVLRVLGFKPKFLTLKRGKYSHAVCAFKMNGRFYWFDNYRLRKTAAATLSQLAEHISTEHHYVQILSWDETLKSWKSLFKNS